MRLFIAIRLNQKMKQTAREVQDTFRLQGVRGNYIPSENLHITLAFIGEYGDPDAVLDAMETVSFSPFTVRMDKIGCFNDLWWMGLSESEELQVLVRRLRHALSEAGIPFDRKKFRAHVTLLRKAFYAGDGRIGQVEFEPAEMQVDCISLMRSTRGRSGMIYTEIGAVTAD